MRENAVAVVGDGSMGTALAQAMATAGRDCTLCCLDPNRAEQLAKTRRHPLFSQVPLADSLRLTSGVSEGVDTAELVIVAVPSSNFRPVVARIAPHVSAAQVLIGATKGLDPTTYERMSELLGRGCSAGGVGVISGPNVTPEIMRGQPTAVVVAGTTPEVLARTSRLLTTPRLRVLGNEDLLGVELLAALKNVVAVAVGISTGLELGANACAVVLTRGMAEVCHLAQRLGARSETFAGLAGVGDIHLTCTSLSSMNRWIGVEIGAGRSCADALTKIQEEPEGIQTLKACRVLARTQGLSLPIAETTYRIVHEGADPRLLEALIVAPAHDFEIDNAIPGRS